MSIDLDDLLGELPEGHPSLEPMPMLCARCYEEADVFITAQCHEEPEKLLGAPLGQYHCPDCGAMVLAGVEHPPLCLRCAAGAHPAFDRVPCPAGECYAPEPCRPGSACRNA